MEVTTAEQASSTSRMGLASSARVSAKTGQGVDKAFERLILRVYEVEHGTGAAGEERAGAAPPKEVPRGMVLTAGSQKRAAKQEENTDCC